VRHRTLLAALSVSALLTAAGCGGERPGVSLTLAVDGRGVVKSTGLRVVCAGTCNRTVELEPGSRRVLTATPAAGWKLAWGGACRSAGTTCKVSPKTRTFVQVTFVRQGARANPVPFGQWARVPGDWRLRIDKTNLNATRAVLAANAGMGAPAVGGHYAVISLAATYDGGGKSRFGGRRAASLTGQMTAVGTKGVYPLKVPANACGPLKAALPAPDLQRNRTDVFSGRTVEGRICFEIAANDAASLMLRVGSRDGQPDPEVWFALNPGA
jgi:hypothetical protein